MSQKFSQTLKTISELPPKEQPIVLAALLSKLFQEKGVNLTVVGGAAVQFYTQAEYVTHDLDAILIGDNKEKIEDVMGSLGFVRTSMYRHFENSLFNFVVEFPPNPIAVGSRWIREVAQVKTKEGTVQIIRPEDLIMDRIIAGVEWKDQPSLDQAKLLFKKNKDEIDKKYLKEFARSEGYEPTLRQIMKS